MRNTYHYLGGISARATDAQTISVSMTWIDPATNRLLFHEMARYEADPRSRLDVLECLVAAAQSQMGIIKGEQLKLF